MNRRYFGLLALVTLIAVGAWSAVRYQRIRDRDYRTAQVIGLDNSAQAHRLDKLMADAARGIRPTADDWQFMLTCVRLRSDDPAILVKSTLEELSHPQDLDRAVTIAHEIHLRHPQSPVLTWLADDWEARGQRVHARQLRNIIASPVPTSAGP